jgi:ribosomal protein L6P/L9E
MKDNSFLMPERDEDIHNKYFIKEGDTFKSVSEALGINWQNLRIYHNTHCIADEDVINADFPSHLKFLLLKPVKLQADGKPETAPLKKAVLSNGFSVPFQPISGKFGVVCTVVNGANEHTLKYEMSLNWLSTDDNGYSFYKIDRLSKIYIDDIEADSIANELAEKTSSILYPLIVVVDNEGEFVDVHNFQEIKERWENRLPEILEAYQGEEVERYLALFAENLKSKETLNLSLSYDWFIRSFFNGIHTGYTSKLSFEGHAHFPFLAKNDDLKFSAEYKIDEYLDEDNLINIEIKGELDEDRTKTDFEYELDLPISSSSDQKAVGSYRARYFLNPNDYTIETLFIECAIDLEVPQKFTVMITDLDAKANLVTGSRESLLMDEVKKEDSFFKMFGDILRGK